MKYHKIETIYERDNVTGRLIEGKYRSKEVEFLKDNIWEFTEKVDGTNIRVIWDGYRVSFGGRKENSSIPAHLLEKLNTLFGGEIKEQLFEQLFGEKEVVLFGEGYGPKIQACGSSYVDEVDFILFDVAINDKYLSRDNVNEIATYFNIQSVPVIFKGTLEEGVKYVKSNPTSVIAKDKTLHMEGLVARPAVELYNSNGERIIVKIKYRDFKEGV